MARCSCVRAWTPIIKPFDASAATLAVCTAGTKVEQETTNVIEFEAWRRWRKAHRSGAR
jgi:hypothetical protein